MGAYELANELGILGAGRRPEWSQIPTAVQESPPGDADGVYLQNARVAYVAIQLRRRVSARTVTVTVDVLDLTAIYTITVGGNACIYNAGGAGAATLQDVLEGIRDAINGVPAAAALVTAVVIDDDGDGVDDTVEIIGDAVADYTIAEVATGTGALTALADSTATTAFLYAKVRGAAKSTSTTAPSGWFKPSGGEWSVDVQGMIERIESAGLNDGFVELSALAGVVGDGGSVVNYARAWLGPAIIEGS